MNPPSDEPGHPDLPAEQEPALQGPGTVCIRSVFYGSARRGLFYGGAGNVV